MPAPIGIFSARADGATTVSVGVAASLSARGRTVLVDLNLDCPEVAPLLDVGCSRTIYHLAYNAQLAPVSAEELEDHIGWRDGLAVLPGITHPEHAERITDHFLSGLLDAASQAFEFVVMDLGRVRTAMPTPLMSSCLLWVAQPSPLGMEVLDRSVRRLEDRGTDWLERTRLVLNRVSERSLAGPERYVADEYGLEVVASVPETSDYWRRVESEHSARALSVSSPEHPRYLSSHGEEALKARRAMEGLAGSVAQLDVAEAVGAGGA